MEEKIDSEKLIKLAEDTTKHKKLVMDNCLLMAEHIINTEGNVDLGIKLLKRGAYHDNSKFDFAEFLSLSSILKSNKCFVDASTSLSSEEKKAIAYHWSHNRHHPEYFEDISEMQTLDKLEMVCDWFARSLQYGTDFIPFIEERQKNRFHFPDKVFEEIRNMCKTVEKLHAAKEIKIE